MAAAKKHFEKQALVAGTKQSRQADKAFRPLALLWAYLLCFVPANNTLVLLKWMFYNLIGVEQLTSPKYLCSYLTQNEKKLKS